MKTLTLLQYLRGTITGHYYPDDSPPDRKLNAMEQAIVRHRRAANFYIHGGRGRLTVFATSLVEMDNEIVGIFEDDTGQTFAGGWSEEKIGFIGVCLPVSCLVTEARVEYNTEVNAHPVNATHMQCDCWGDKGRPIFLSGGRPTRHVSSSNASLYSWRKLHRGKMGWVQDSD